MNIDEGKELAIALCEKHGSTFEAVAGRTQARGVTSVRRKVINELYGHGLREWQIAKIIGKHVSTVWAYRHLDQKKGMSRDYKERHRGGHRRNVGKRKSQS